MIKAVNLALGFCRTKGTDMEKLIIAAVVSGALMGVAADNSYPWTAGDTSLGDGAVTITYDGETTDIATLTVNPTDGGTITLTGDAMTFADGATIMLSSSGTVSFAEQVTTKGALSLSRSDGAYVVWTGNVLTETAAQKDSLLAVMGDHLIDDFEPSSIVFVATGSECPGRFDRYVSGPSSAIFVINRVEADHSYTIRPQLSRSAGIRCITAARSQRFGYYPSTGIWDNKKIQGIDRGYWAAGAFSNNGENLGRTSTLGLTKFYLALKGMATPVQVRFDGGSEFGGETTVGVGVEAVLAVPEGDNKITGKFVGDGDVRIVPMAPTTTAGSYYLEPWITTSWQVIATNRSLSALTALAGMMQGGSHGPGSTTGGSACRAYWLKPNPADNTVDCQFQLKSGDNNKVVLAKLRQNGANVEIKAVKAGRVAVATYPVGTDLTDVTLTSAGLATSTNTSGYGIHMITATIEGTSSMGCVTLEGSMDAMVGNQLTFDGGERPLYVTVTSKTAFPSYGDVNVGTNATVALRVDGLTVSQGVSGGTSTLNVLRGGVLSRHDNGQIGKQQQVVVDGGTLVHSTGGGVYLNYLLMKDGVHMTSSSSAPRSAFDNTRSYYNVVGTEPSSIEGLGIRPYGNSTVSSVRTFQINVNDVTGDEQVDCTLTGIQAPASNYEYYHFEKWGDGTLKLDGSGKAVRLESTLYGGTFLLGASDSMTNAVVLAGGSLAVDAGKSNSLGNLTANTNATLTVGAGGSLSFASFTAGEELQQKAITIEAPLKGNVLRFGNDDTALSSAQRAYFRWRDPTDETVFYRVKVDAQGYVHPRMNGIVIVVK